VLTLKERIEDFWLIWKEKQENKSKPPFTFKGMADSFEANYYESIEAADHEHYDEKPLLETIQELRVVTTQEQYRDKLYLAYLKIDLFSNFTDITIEQEIESGLLLLNQWETVLYVITKEFDYQAPEKGRIIELPFLKQYPDLVAWYVEWGNELPDRKEASIFIIPTIDVPTQSQFVKTKFNVASLPKTKTVDFLETLPHFAEQRFNFLFMQEKAVHVDLPYVYDVHTGEPVIGKERLGKKANKKIRSIMGSLRKQQMVILSTDIEGNIVESHHNFSTKELIQYLEYDSDEYEDYARVVVPDNKRWLIASTSPGSFSAVKINKLMS
jgi:hypothetical protein